MIRYKKMIRDILDKLLKKNNKVNLEKNIDMYGTEYENYLFNQNGFVNKTNGKKISLLIIADTHGALKEDELKECVDKHYYDACIMLGDHYDKDIQIIINTIDHSKLYGIMGNHDYNYLDKYNIININGKIIEINGVKILGMEGSFKYKAVHFPSFTQEESIVFLENQPQVDILISHDRKYDYTKKNDLAHQGLIGITNYIFKNKIPIHIHGHIHENYCRKMINGTIEYSVFGFKIIEIVI